MWCALLPLLESITPPWRMCGYRWALSGWENSVSQSCKRRKWLTLSRLRKGLNRGRKVKEETERAGCLEYQLPHSLGMVTSCLSQNEGLDYFGSLDYFVFMDCQLFLPLNGDGMFIHSCLPFQRLSRNVRMEYWREPLRAGRLLSSELRCSDSVLQVSGQWQALGLLGFG